MSTRYSFVAAALTAFSVLGVTIAAQQPRISNARLASQAGANLQQTFRSLVAAQTEPAWIGYSVPVNDRSRTMCCWSSGDGNTYFSGTISSGSAPCCGSCSIEPSSDGSPRTPGTIANQGPIKLEGSDTMVVLFRVAERQVERIRAFSEDCAIDAGGRQVHWLENVRPADSIALLESLVGVEGGRRTRVTNSALSAMSMHAEPSAAATIERLARSHTSPSIRSEAIFWLSQLAGQKVAGAITDAIANDPDTDVKKRAVFALSQLPKGEGVPLLIDVARRNPNPAVKKQAIFWLGQSRDPRAIDFFAQILK